jgi:hypothetical protein
MEEAVDTVGETLTVFNKAFLFIKDHEISNELIRWVRTFTYPVSNFTIAKNFNHGYNF